MTGPKPAGGSSRRPHSYEIVQARDHTGRMAYYVIMLSAVKRPLFYRALEAGELDLAHYGDIVESAYADTVPQDVRSRYGFTEGR